MIVPAMVLACLVLACFQSAFALDPALDVSQYAHMAWKVSDGFAKSEITSIAQTPDGYLWLGTELGLYHFDGVNNLLWHPPAGQELPSNWIFSLFTARDGTLWIGTAQGLASWKDGKLTQHPDLAKYYVLNILEDRQGTIWASGITINTGRLCAIQSSGVQCAGDDGAIGRGAFGLYEDSKGNLWAGVKNGLYRWNPGPPTYYPLAGESDGIQTFSEDTDGTLLVGWRGTIQRFTDGKMDTYQLLGSTRQVHARRILRDRQGGVWIGTVDHGLIHIHQGKADTFATTDGLSGEIVNAMFEDREGNIWVATRSGLDRFHDFAVATYSTNQGLSSAYVNSVLADRNGGVWLATHDGLDQWTNSGVKSVVSAGKNDHFKPNSLFQDSSGRLWVSTPSQTGYLENNSFIPVISVPGAVASMAQDNAGNLWIANEHAGLFQVLNRRLAQQIPWSRLGHTDHVSVMAADSLQGGLWLGFYKGGIAHFSDGRIQSSYAVEQGLGPGRVSDLLLEHDGTLWIATEGGLSRLKNGRIATLTTRNGFPCDTVHWLKEDDAQGFWFYTTCGLIRIPRAELDNLANAVEQNVNAKQTFSAMIFDSSDGVKGLAAGNHFSPTVAKSTDGRFWFTGLDGVSTVDPGHLNINQLQPPVHIEQFIADRNSYDADSIMGGRLQLPPLIRNLQIEYTALSLVGPDKILFRYMLEGHDTAWQEAGNRRLALYNDLPPGNYRFRVTACNNNGVWNATGTFLDFNIAPAYYQTTWFRVLIIAALLFMLGAVYQLRLRQVARQVHARMEERLEERERIARDLHDTLLQSVQGLILKFDAVAKQIPPDQPAHEAIQRTLDRADEVLAEGRDRVRNLRGGAIPMGGLPAAFQSVVEEISLGSDARFKTLVEGAVLELHPMVGEEAYCIGREAIINALTHAKGDHIEVEIAYNPRQFRLRVRDDGQGFDTRILEKGGLPGHWGLPGMRERASRIGAELKIWSGHQTGTEVELLVPGSTAYLSTRSGPKRSWFRRISKAGNER